MKHIHESIIGRKGNYQPRKYFISELIFDEKKIKSKGLYNNFDKFDKWLGKIEQKMDFNEFTSCLIDYGPADVDNYEGYINDRNFIMQIWNDLDELYERAGQQEYICGAFQIEEFGDTPDNTNPANADVIFINMAGRTFYLYKK